MTWNRLMVAAMGGFQSPLITTIGGSGTLPDDCIGLIPNPGCKFTDIRSTERPLVNLAEEMNIVGLDIGDSDLYTQCPIMCRNGYLFTVAIISAGSFKPVIAN